MVKPLSNNNEELDATLSIILSDLGFKIVFESRGGGERGRNTDYQRAVVAVLNRMAAQDMILQNAQIASRTVSKLPEEERILRR